jgi:hypothetical protein
MVATIAHLGRKEKGSEDGEETPDGSVSGRVIDYFGCGMMSRRI